MSRNNHDKKLANFVKKTKKKQKRKQNSNPFIKPYKISFFFLDLKSGGPASPIKIGNSIVRSEESEMVGNRTSRSQKGRKNSVQRSITKPTAFADLMPSLKTLNCIGPLISSSFLVLNMFLQILSIILAQWKPTLDFLSNS